MSLCERGSLKLFSLNFFKLATFSTNDPYNLLVLSNFDRFGVSVFGSASLLSLASSVQLYLTAGSAFVLGTSSDLLTSQRCLCGATGFALTPDLFALADVSPFSAQALLWFPASSFPWPYFCSSAFYFPSLDFRPLECRLLPPFFISYLADYSTGSV